MKYVLFFFLIIAFNFAYAGPRVNNGGGVWVCRKNDTANVVWIKSHDLFLLEMFDRLSQKFDFMKAWKIYEMQLGLISENFPSLAKMIQQYPLDLKSILRIEDISVDLIGDGGIDLRPLKSSCPDGRVGFEQVADFIAKDLLFLDSKIWHQPMMKEVDKAIIFMHEHIYYVLRKANDEESSVRTQQLVATIFADLPIDIANERVDKILQSSGHPREAGTVILFPINLNCYASVLDYKDENGHRSYSRVGEKFWSNFGEGSILTGEVSE
ncbi:MAG: hypothetical protein V4654_04915 [Bdellovibrionota bacterium]